MPRSRTSRKRRARPSRNGKSHAQTSSKGNFEQTRNSPITAALSAVGSGSTFTLTKNVLSSDSLIVPLRYVLPIAVLTGAGVANSLRYTSNAYDVDSALASTAMAGFTEYAALYARFRTLQMSYHFEVSNQENFGVQVISGFSLAQISSTALGANYSENPYFKLSMCGSSGGMNKVSHRQSASVAQVVGSAQALFDDLYTGSTTSSTLATAGTMNLYLGTISPAIPVNGVTISGYVTLLIQFYRRTMLIS